MGLYQYKDFLTLDDVGYFLLSKGLLPPVPIEQLYLSDLRPFIISMIQSDKITPVFDYDGYVIIIDRNIYEYEVDTYKGMVQASHTMIQNWKKGKAIFYKPFKGQFDPFQDTFVNERYRKYIDDGKQIILYAQNYDDDTTEVYLQYPREQLEAIFNQPTNTEQTKDEQITTLQQQLQKAQARIKELESTQNAGVNDEEKELTANSKKAISKLLYALMAEHGYLLDGTTKGNLNDVLLNLAKKHNAEISKDTVANWLEYLNDKYYYNQKGK